jgi:hypothetical protein
MKAIKWTEPANRKITNSLRNFKKKKSKLLELKITLSQDEAIRF